MHSNPVVVELDVLEDILLRLLSCFIASLDADCVMPWESKQRRNALDAYRTPWPSWKTRLPSLGGSSRPAACSIASMATFPVIRSDIDQPTALREKASITAARQSRPSRVGMQVMPPTQSLFLSPTEKTRSTRFRRGSPGSTFFAILCLLAAPSATIPSFCMICSTRFSLTTMPPRRNSWSMRR